MFLFSSSTATGEHICFPFSGGAVPTANYRVFSVLGNFALLVFDVFGVNGEAEWGRSGKWLPGAI